MKGSEFLRQTATTTPAVVVGAAGGVALGVIRDLGHEGVPVVAVGPVERDAALRSRYAVPAHCGIPHFNEERVVDDLVAIARKIGRKAVLFAAEDDYVAVVSRHIRVLREHYFIPMLDWDHMEKVIDKVQQFELARNAGVEVPATAVIRSEAHLEEVSAGPRAGSGSRSRSRATRGSSSARTDSSFVCSSRATRGSRSTTGCRSITRRRW